MFAHTRKGEKLSSCFCRIGRSQLYDLRMYTPEAAAFKKTNENNVVLVAGDSDPGPFGCELSTRYPLKY